MAMLRSGTRLTEQPIKAGDIAPVPTSYTDRFQRHMAYGQASVVTTDTSGSTSAQSDTTPFEPPIEEETVEVSVLVPAPQPTPEQPIHMSLDDALEPDNEGTGRETAETLIQEEQPETAQDLATKPGEAEATHGGSAKKADELLEVTTTVNPVDDKAAWTVEDHIQQFVAQGGNLRHLIIAADETYADCRMLTENFEQTRESLADAASQQEPRMNAGIAYIAYQLRRVDSDGMQSLVAKADSIRLEEEKSGKARALQPAHSSSRDMDLSWRTPSSPALAA